jgi:hypothetical protein
MDGGADFDIVLVHLLRIDIVPFFVDNDRRPASESRTSAFTSDSSSAARTRDCFKLQ